MCRQHYGDDPFAQTLSSISPTYMRKYRSSIAGTTVCTLRNVIATSRRKETKYTASTNGTELEEGNQEEKTSKDTMEVSNNFIALQFSFNKSEK